MGTQVHAGEPDGIDAESIEEGIDPGAYGRRWRILATLCLSLMAVMLANSSINLALPALSRELGLTQLELTWVVEAYALVFASLLFIASAVADRYGRRIVMQVGLGLFLAASMYAGFVAGSGTELIAARLLMGIGGAMVMPTTLSIVNVVFPRRERAKAIAVWSGIAGAGIMLGSIASGLLLEFFSWESTFLFGGFVAVAALVGNQVVVPESHDPARTPVDWTGGVLATTGLAGVVYAIMEVPSHGLGDPIIAGALVGGLVALAAFVWWELRTDHPLLDVRMFRAPSLGLSALAITLTFFALMGAFFGLSQMFQLVMGFSALTSSVAFLPVMLPMILLSPFVPRVVARVGTKLTVAPGLAIVAIGFLLMANWPAEPSYWEVLAAVAVMVVGMALVMTTATNMMMAAVPRHRSGMGSALNDTTREFGAALGIAVLGSMVSSGYTQHVAGAIAGLPDQARELASRSLGGAILVAEQMGDAGASLVTAARAAFMAGNSSAMVVSAGIVVMAAIIVAIGLPNRLTTEPTDEPTDDDLELVVSPRMDGLPAADA
ncbi:MAG: MFS transporter [Chloroflexi bacterium]|nr:MFS transporter [Chloroflexota bacterium]